MKITRAMVVLYDDRDNEVARLHHPVHREVEPGQVLTLNVTIKAEAVPDGD